MAGFLICFCSLAGALLCGVGLFFGVESVCSSEGCGIYSGGLYQPLLLAVGMAGFSFLGLSRLLGRSGMLWGACIAAACVELLLLGWQIIYVPCSFCLAAGGLFLVIAVACAAERGWRDRVVLSSLLPVFMLLLSVNAVSLSKSEVGPWRIAGGRTPDADVFFSPTCPACIEMVLGMAKTEERVGFVPVAKSAEDLLIISYLEARIAGGEEFIPAFRKFTSSGSQDALLQRVSVPTRLRARVWLNKLLLLWKGESRVPVLIAGRLPSGRVKNFDPFASPRAGRRAKSCGALSEVCE